MSTDSVTLTSALAGRTMPTRYPDKACRYCAATPTAVAHLDGTTWHSVCATCAVSYTAQAMGLLARAEALGESLTGDTLTAYTAACEALGPSIAAALGVQQDAACRPIVPGLLTLLAGFTPTPVRPNKYAKPCHRCGTTVPEGQGRIEMSGAGTKPVVWLTFHLDGQCPEAPAEAPVPAVAAGPLAATEATRTIRNKRAGKCLSCGVKVPEGKGWAMQGLPDARGWAVLHDECADSLSNDRLGLVGLLTNLGFRIRTLTGTDTRDHAVRLAVDFITGDGDGSQPVIFLRVCWGVAGMGVEVVTGGPGAVHRTPVGARRASTITRNLLALSDDALAKAQADYGQKMGECGRCGAPLTDVESRRIGLGPDCAGKHRHH
jgi:hypothetical protein